MTNEKFIKETLIIFTDDLRFYEIRSVFGLLF